MATRTTHQILSISSLDGNIASSSARRIRRQRSSLPPAFPVNEAPVEEVSVRALDELKNIIHETEIDQETSENVEIIQSEPEMIEEMSDE